MWVLLWDRYEGRKFSWGLSIGWKKIVDISLRCMSKNHIDVEVYDEEERGR